MARELRIPRRATGHGRSRRIRARRKEAPDCRSRHRHRQNAGVPGPGDSLRQARRDFHRHQKSARAALLQGHPVSRTPPGPAARLLHEGPRQLRLPPENLRRRKGAHPRRPRRSRRLPHHPRMGEDHRNRRPQRDQDAARSEHRLGQDRRAQRAMLRTKVSAVRALLHHRHAPARAGERHHHRQSPPVLRRSRRERRTHGWIKGAKPAASFPTTAP